MSDKNEVELAVADVLSRSKNAIDANILYREFIGMSNIERVGEEEYVIKQIMVGTSFSKIREYLKAKYPDYSFTTNDFDKFLARNREIAGTPNMELVSPEGHNSNESDILTWFYNALKRASKIPFQRFEKENGGGNIFTDAAEMTRGFADGLKTSK